MITIFIDKHNIFSKRSYDDLLDSLPFHQLECTCGVKGLLIKHGFYTRYIKLSSTMVELKILRLYCKSCHATHALLPSSIVPYSQVSLEDHLLIIECFLENKKYDYIMLRNFLIDENNIRYIIKNFNKYWRERLRSYKINLNFMLVDNCFVHFKRQFMQIKCTSNILFL